MFLIGISIMIYALGFFFYFLTYMFPRLQEMYMDWIALIFFVLPWAIVLYRMQVTDSYKQTDRIPKWKTLVYFIKRDKGVVPLTGDRAFPGQSFLNVPPIGLIEHMGKDSVLNLGDKKISFVVENNYTTVEPELLLASHMLYELGIHDKFTLAKLLLGKDLDYGDLKLMGQVYINMLKYDGDHGGAKLVKEWTEIKPYEENVEFKPPPKNDRHKEVARKVDWIWKYRDGNKSN